MSTVIKVVASGMHAQQAKLEAVGHNLANVNTTAFKTSRIEFQDREYNEHLIEVPVPGGATVVASAWAGTGVTASNRTIFSQGSPVSTGYPTDMAILGDGFFQVRLPNGSAAYTRNGAFGVDSGGSLVSGEGHLLEPPIRTLPGATLRLGQAGQVDLIDVKGEVVGSAGAVKIAMFPSPEGLLAVGKGLFLATGASGAATLSPPGENGAGTLVPGAIEQSNVSVADEMVAMLEAQRAYQASAKAVSAMMEMLDEANSLSRAG